MILATLHFAGFLSYHPYLVSTCESQLHSFLRGLVHFCSQQKWTRRFGALGKIWETCSKIFQQLKTRQEENLIPGMKTTKKS